MPPADGRHTGLHLRQNAPRIGNQRVGWWLSVENRRECSMEKEISAYEEKLKKYYDSEGKPKSRCVF